MTNNKLSDFLRRAKPEERERVATAAGTSVAYLYQLASAKHRRVMNLLMACALSRATVELAIATDHRTPVLSLDDLERMYLVEETQV